MTRRARIRAILLAGAIACCALGNPLRAHAQTIRVLLASHQLQTIVASEGGVVVRSPDGGAPLLQPEITTVFDVRPGAGGLMLAGAISTGSRILAEPLLDAPLVVDGRTYRGRVWITRDDDGTLDVVNELDLEQYLYGVVGVEMDPAWPQVALQAQAIASRSYAVARAALHAYPGYDVKAGELDQAYGGVNAEAQGPVDAVESTRGVILVYQYHVVRAYYSSCDGGYTADGNELSDPQPYLRAQPDPYSGESPHLAWSASVPLAAFAQALRAQAGDVGDITAVSPGLADASGRLTSVTVTGTNGARTIPGALFRQLAGRHVVKSTRIASIAVEGDMLIVRGSGFGHGVGMSQWGAKDMADQGLGINAILSFYYRGTMLSKI
ncbi:MAG: SpoIID/LytB domain-containing protein [Casimicrobiaceae bacterium]